MLGDLRLVPVRANRQPGAANYVRAPGDTEFRAMALDVLRFEDGRLVEMTAFAPELFARPPGFTEITAVWSALSTTPAPLAIRLKSDKEVSEWF